MDSRTETDVREDQARRTYAGLSERAGHLQQQVGSVLQSTVTYLESNDKLDILNHF